MTDSLFAQRPDTTYRLDFNIKAKKLIGGGFELINKNLKKEFTLQGQTPAKYLIEIKNDSISVLSKFENDKWSHTDTISQMFMMVTDTSELLIPSFQVTDFNNDGNQDLICWTGTNVNGNYWVIVYLNNPQKKTLEKLKNTAEESFIWDAPVYNPKDSSIKCTRASGVYGLSFESTYKLVNYSAIPIEKEESDNTQMNSKGKGGVTRYYIGKDGKWKLKKEIKD